MPCLRNPPAVEYCRLLFEEVGEGAVGDGFNSIVGVFGNHSGPSIETANAGSTCVPHVGMKPARRYVRNATLLCDGNEIHNQVVDACQRLVTNGPIVWRNN